jgi:hypothetical protein
MTPFSVYTKNASTLSNALRISRLEKMLNRLLRNLIHHIHDNNNAFPIYKNYQSGNHRNLWMSPPFMHRRPSHLALSMQFDVTILYTIKLILFKQSTNYKPGSMHRRSLCMGTDFITYVMPLSFQTNISHKRIHKVLAAARHWHHIMAAAAEMKAITLHHRNMYDTYL